jgi:hypothetical protein
MNVHGERKTKKKKRRTPIEVSLTFCKDLKQKKRKGRRDELEIRMSDQPM